MAMASVGRSAFAAERADGVDAVLGALVARVGHGREALVDVVARVVVHEKARLAHAPIRAERVLAHGVHLGADQIVRRALVDLGALGVSGGGEALTAHALVRADRVAALFRPAAIVRLQLALVNICKKELHINLFTNTQIKRETKRTVAEDAVAGEARDALALEAAVQIGALGLAAAVGCAECTLVDIYIDVKYLENATHHT